MRRPAKQEHGTGSKENEVRGGTVAWSGTGSALPGTARAPFLADLTALFRSLHPGLCTQVQP